MSSSFHLFTLSSMIALSLGLVPSAQAARSMIEIIPAAEAQSARTLTPVAILKHADGRIEVAPLERHDDASCDNEEDCNPSDPWRDHWGIPTGIRVDGAPISLSFLGGIELARLEGVALSVGIIVGDLEKGWNMRWRNGALFEANVGLEATKLGLGWTLGTNWVGGNINFTYLASYGANTPVPQGQDLLGVELGLHASVLHGFVGVLKSIQDGEVYANFGLGVRYF